MSLFNRNDKSGDTPQTSQPQKLQTPQPPPKDSAVLKPALPPIPAPIPQPYQPSAKTGAHMASVISKALKITGQLESTEDIQIDGEIDGDVRGVGVKIGQHAKVKGTVYGDEVELAGAIEGKIEAKKVILTGTARMTGDVVHQDIKIESGAYVSGNLKPEAGKTDTRPALKPVASSANAASSGVSSASVSPISH
jgi:cytoskeletal protein CcmA (bactofilin family)